MACATSPLPPSDTLVLCANQRSANRLKLAYHRAQQAHSRIWEAPTIWALNPWLSTQWQQCLGVDGTLLTDLEELFLWQRLLQADGMHKMAKLAQQAWRNLTLWDLPLALLRDEPNTDVAHFYQWSLAFNELKQAQGLVSPAELPKRVLALFQQGELALPPRVQTVGFDTLAPTVKQLLDYLSEHCEWVEPPKSTRTAVVQRLSLEHQATEIRAMAEWAKQQHQANPRQVIGCVVPNLSNLRAEVVQTFEDVFSDTPYNISAGVPFKQIPMIHTALTLLQGWLKPSLTLMQTLLLSPYLASSLEDRCVAALTWQSLTQQSAPTLTLASVAEQATYHASHGFAQSQLPQRLSALAALAPPRGALSLTEAAHHFEQALLTAGWPGQRNPDSTEYQIIERWHQLLLEFCRLERCMGAQSLTDAFTALSTLAHETVFQAKTDEQPIQILGLLEASGGEFDQLWMMGLHDEAWPPKAEPNPFLPVSLQRQHALPHASAKRELEFCLEVQQRLLQSADVVMISAPCREGDKLLQPSPLIRAWPLGDATPWLPAESVRHAPALTLSPWQDNQGPALDANEHVRGGSRILQLQAECPFRAFATIRLRAEPLASPHIGLSKQEQGTLTHLALEYTWNTLKTQQALLSMPPVALAQLTEDAIARAVTHSQFQTGHFLAVERRRLQRLLQQWLTLERERPPFSVLEHETQRHVSFGPLKLSLKIDRIDTLDDGSHLVIDYKTGQYQSVQDWLGPRPRQPQLPLYSLLLPNAVAGICYAQVTALAPQFKGIARADATFKGLTSAEKVAQQPLSWTQLQQQWQQNLEQLSDEFCQGHAVVAPLDPTSCRLCHLQPLCRIGDFA